MLPGKIQIALTKIIPPKRRTDLLSRQRLLDQLDNLTENRLTLLSAPAGYGKTSLLVDMTTHTGLPVCWYALDRIDQDPSRFFAYLIHAIAQKFPTFGDNSDAVTHGSTFSTEELDTIVTVMSNEIYQNINEHFILVLDDFHLVHDVEPIIYFINQFIQRVDDNCHVVLCSRTLTILPDMPLLVARSQVGGLSFDDLAFQADEIKDLALQNYHLTISDEAAGQLARDTEGWVTALMLSTNSLWRGMSSRLQASQVSGIGLYEYLQQQVLAIQSAEVKLFLQRTAFLEEFDTALCQDVLGPILYPDGADWQGLMDSVQQNNLFVLPVGENGSWLRYHHLFSDFLQKNLLKERPKERDLILHQLAGITLQRGEVEKAYALYKQLGDEMQIADLVVRYGALMLRNGRLATLAAWLNALPKGIVSQNAELLSFSGSIEVMQGRVKIGLALLNQADRMLRGREDVFPLATNLVRRAVTQQMMGDFALSLADSDEAIQMADHLDQKGISTRAEALLPAGYCYYQLGQIDKAIHAFEQSLALFHALKDEDREAQVFMELGISYSSNGDNSSALAAYQQALIYFKKKGNLTWLANIQNNLGVFYLNQGKFVQAYQHLEDALDCARLSGYARLEAFTLTTIGDLYSELDSWDAASNAYLQAEPIAQRTDEKLLQLQIFLARAHLAWKQGDFTLGESLIQTAKSYTQANLSDYENNYCSFEEGCMYLGMGNKAQAVQALQTAREGFKKGTDHIKTSQVSIYLAAAYQALNEQENAQSEIIQALSITKGFSQQQELISAVRDVRNIIGQEIQTLTSDRRITRMTELVNQFEHELPAIRRHIRRMAAAVPFGLPRVNIHTLGKIQTWLDGKLVTTSQWQTQVARDLFLLLLAHPNGLTKEEIALIFWPDDSENQVRVQFKNTIYRLRRALGQNVILFDNEHYRFNQELDYEYDVELFKTRLEQVKTETDPTRRMKIWREGLDLYKGPYLATMDDDWALAIRENLWDVYLNSSLTYTETLLENGDYPAVLGMCTRILEQDSCQEDAYRLVMRAYAAQGNQAEVARQYEHCTEALQRELGVEPSGQTRQLYKTLIHS
jgi:ATP/maltotriose-dependent transcriptional regulator MalT/DNA-binding SARP family transcriptional activator